MNASNGNGDFDLIVVGAGAAGFFGAINFAEFNPGSKIIILEKSHKLLSKVRVSGGGRCNVTHSCFNPFQLARHYPRGEKQLKQLFKEFDAEAMIAWLKDKDVKLHTEDDGRMFPVSNSSQTIIDCFLREAAKYSIKIQMGAEVDSITKSNRLVVSTRDGQSYISRAILIAIGGNASSDFYEVIRRLGHSVNRPIPSLFTFNEKQKSYADLMGVAVSDCEVKIEGTRYSQRGPVLITHWGLSGPAVIKLSAWAAVYLHEQRYKFNVLINWTGDTTEASMKEQLSNLKKDRAKQKVVSRPAISVPIRLWERLCVMSEISDDRMWQDLSNRQINKLTENLIRSRFNIEGKTTFKEEFVTCGGVPLDEVEVTSMESKICPGIYFAGEVLDIDGETGGFNFQAAWSTAYIAAKEIARNSTST